PEAAIAGWDAVLAAGEDPRARLARGALLARAGRWQPAAADLACAGDGFGARWDRASPLVHQAVGGERDAPDPAARDRARAEGATASDYWSDPSVARLLWSLLVEREVARRVPGGPPPGGATRQALRDAEGELEFATFWDRALVLLGWARLEAREET